MKFTPVSSSADVGFQIAPMIDVVFVILVFFMAMAAQIRVEQTLSTRLPGTAEAESPTEFFDEQIITIDESQGVALNDEPYAQKSTDSLDGLIGTLLRLRETTEAAKARLAVTVVSHPDVPYRRTIDVLDALKAAGVDDVAFTAEPLTSDE